MNLTAEQLQSIAHLANTHLYVEAFKALRDKNEMADIDERLLELKMQLLAEWVQF
jgi:hypothetical protein